MKKSLLIIITVALLGIIAAYMAPPQSKTATAITSVTTSNLNTVLSNSEEDDATNAPSRPAAQTTQYVSYKNGTFSGSSVFNGYGNVQVAVNISGGKITGINFLQIPQDNIRSQSINNYAAPQLVSETLAVQSANINNISGATLTTNSYIQSLQAALNSAKI